MLARLPILLAQIKAGNNSRELKNEIRQLLYSLYRSKQISKTANHNIQIAKQNIQINLFTISLTN